MLSWNLNSTKLIKCITWVELMVFWRKMASFICFITKSYKIVIVNGTLVCFTSYSPVMGRIAKCIECYSSSSKSIRKSVRFSESSMASFSDISPFFDFFCKAARSWHNFCVLYIHQERQHKRCRFLYG